MLGKRFFGANGRVDQEWLHDSGSTVRQVSEVGRPRGAGVRALLARRLTAMARPRRRSTRRKRNHRPSARLAKLSGESLHFQTRVRGATRSDAVGRSSARSWRSCALSSVDVAIVVGAGKTSSPRPCGCGRGMERAIRRLRRPACSRRCLNSALAAGVPLERAGRIRALHSALELSEVAYPYILRRAIRHLREWGGSSFRCRHGNPFRSRPTRRRLLRALEIGADRCC